MTDLYLPATPEQYVATGHAKRGLVFSVGEGAGNVDYDMRGIVAPYCTYEAGIGYIEESPSLQRADVFTSVEKQISYMTNQGQVDIPVPLHQEGFDPLRTLLVSDSFGSELPGGKTLYSIEVLSDCQDVVYVGASRRISHKDPFQFMGWRRIQPYTTRGGPITSGIEFKVLVFTVGAGLFKIDRVTAWIKLTDRRGFHTFPGVPNDSQGATD